MQIVGPFNSTPADASGDATWTTPSAMIGYVYGIYVKYNDSPPATTDVTISTQGTGSRAPATTLLTLTNANTDGWFYPRVTAHDTAGASVATEYLPQSISDQVKITVAGAALADHVDVWLVMDSDYSYG